MNIQFTLNSEVNKMKRQLKSSVVYGLYAISFALLVGGVTLLAFSLRKTNTYEDKVVSKGILDYEEQIPVVSADTKIIRPYLNEDIKIVKKFYDYQAEASTQEQSLFYYEGTYMQSSGVSYSNGNTFDVVAILDGSVKEIK